MDYCIANIEESFDPMLSADFSAENTNGYRYGFNGKEQDPEWNGVGNMDRSLEFQAGTKEGFSGTCF